MDNGRVEIPARQAPCPSPGGKTLFTAMPLVCASVVTLVHIPVAGPAHREPIRPVHLLRGLPGRLSRHRKPPLLRNDHRKGPATRQCSPPAPFFCPGRRVPAIDSPACRFGDQQL